LNEERPSVDHAADFKLTSEPLLAEQSHTHLKNYLFHTLIKQSKQTTPLCNLANKIIAMQRISTPSTDGL
jgi:hypothetical protein